MPRREGAECVQGIRCRYCHFPHDWRSWPKLRTKLNKSDRAYVRQFVADLGARINADPTISEVDLANERTLPLTFVQNLACLKKLAKIISTAFPHLRVLELPAAPVRRVPLPPGRVIQTPSP